MMMMWLWWEIERGKLQRAWLSIEGGEEARWPSWSNKQTWSPFLRKWCFHKALNDDKRKERFDNLITTSFPFCKPSIWRWVSAGKIFSHRKSHFSWLCSSASVNQRFLLNQSTGRSLANLLLSGMILGYDLWLRFFQLLRSFRKERFPGTAEILLSRGISPNCLRFSAQANLRSPHLLISSSWAIPSPFNLFFATPHNNRERTHISCLMHVKWAGAIKKHI